MPNSVCKKAGHLHRWKGRERKLIGETVPLDCSRYFQPPIASSPPSIKVSGAFGEICHFEKIPEAFNGFLQRMRCLPSRERELLALSSKPQQRYWHRPACLRFCDWVRRLVRSYMQENVEGKSTLTSIKVDLWENLFLDVMKKRKVLLWRQIDIFWYEKTKLFSK